MSDGTKQVMDLLEADREEKPLKVAIIGDSVIDEYFYVTANRVSPEFPIPVMRSDTARPTMTLPGAAGNVASQFRPWNVDTRLYTLLDKKLQGVLGKSGSNFSRSAFMNTDGRVPVKKRLYQGNFPLCRWDVEQYNYGLNDVDIKDARERLYESYMGGPKPDVAVFSDYNKGLFSPDINWVGGHKCATIVDPKSGPLEKWTGCDVFKPNAKEARDLSGYTDWKKQADFFQRNLGCKAVVITEGGTGVCGIYKGKHFEYRPDDVCPAESVIGAGDCFLAFLAMTVLRMNFQDAVRVAWQAGAVYVGRKHNRPVQPQELLRYVNPTMAKYVTADFLRDRDFPITLTNGCFDLLHSGHIALLRYCKSVGHKVVVAVNSDESVAGIKGPGRPVVPVIQRMEALANLEVVDYVTMFTEPTPKALIDMVLPEVLVKGGDYKPEEVVGADSAEEVKIFPLASGLSTTSLIEKIKAQ
jgi:D-beta-D-heptose 7-phosphate kinase/D-beta-D-heptose 1-phosphate adenosyltransferase